MGPREGPLQPATPAYNLRERRPGAGRSGLHGASSGARATCAMRGCREAGARTLCMAEGERGTQTDSPIVGVDVCDKVLRRVDGKVARCYPDVVPDQAVFTPGTRRKPGRVDVMRARSVQRGAVHHRLGEDAVDELVRLARTRDGHLKAIRPVQRAPSPPSVEEEPQALRCSEL